VGDRCHRAQFAKETIFLAARCVQNLNVGGLRSVLAGLGVHSSVALLIDGVPLAGLPAHGRQGPVTVTCLKYASATDGRLRPRSLAWAMSNSGHGGESIANSGSAALAESPVGIQVDALKGLLRFVGRVEAIVLGGAARKTPATQGVEILWRKVYGVSLDHLCDHGDDARLRDIAAPRSRVERDVWLGDADNLHSATGWDKFHREDISCRRAFAAALLATELLALCKLMDGWFGHGDGRFMVKQAASVAGVRLRRGGLPANTRRIISLSEEPGFVLQNCQLTCRRCMGNAQRQTGG
jgi:hypothetical protein